MSHMERSIILRKGLLVEKGWEGRLRGNIKIYHSRHLSSLPLRRIARAGRPIPVHAFAKNDM